MRKKVHDAQMLRGLRGQVLQQYNRRLEGWPLGRLPKRTIPGVLGVSERDIGLEIIASERSGTEFKLLVSVRLDDQEVILDFADLIPLSESGGVKGRAFWGSRQRQRDLYSDLAKAKSQEARGHLFHEAVRTGKIRSGDFKVSLILDYEAAAGSGESVESNRSSPKGLLVTEGLGKAFKEAKETAAAAFERFDTKSHSEAVVALFAQALPCLPVVTTEDIRRICAETLKYQVEHGHRHVMGSADDLRPIITRNLEGAEGQLYPGQRIIGFQVSIQSELQFAALSIVVGDAQGSPGYMFGARFWRTTDQIFLLGWEGFQLSA